jgi:D-alanyl-D-alanine carboxypeptidase/D-alanyl-D-alanine-endopeptidase (penicillin-binding protein 4)
MTFTKLKFVAALTATLLLIFLASRTDFIKSQHASPLQSTGIKEKAAADSSSAERKTDPKVAGSEFAESIDRLIDESEFASARWGISVISLSNGIPIYQRNADKLFTPASNMKIYTTAVALELLGGDYRWRTSVYASGEPAAGGTIPGDLILYGRGAPDLVTENKDPNQGSLAKLADDIYARGIRRVKGNIIGDESYFRGNLLGDGWQWNDIQWYFGAEASALSVNGNEIDVNLIPAGSGKAPEVKTSDTENYVTVENRMTVGNRAQRSTIGLYRGLSDNNIEVWGEFAPGSKGFGARLSVYKPALWAAKLFLQKLKARGIAVEGHPQARNSRVPPSQRFDSAKGAELAYVTSQPLHDIARTTNKESNNLYAELILRTLGRERAAMLDRPPPPGRELGDDEAGLGLIRMWLARAGIATGTLALHDGSGLSRLNLVTPESTARLLVALSKAGSSQPFRQSLPVAGRDGTLAGRLKTVRERVLAKTGSLTYDNSLSGYLTTSNGQVFAFSMFCNDHAGRGNSVRLIDQITSLLVGYPARPPEKAQKSE